jgi:addiction module HigA family antidote
MQFRDKDIQNFWEDPDKNLPKRVLSGKRERLEGSNLMTTTNSYISTPGEILYEEFLQPLSISQYALAKAIHKPQSAISDIVHGRRAITTEMAWLLGQALGTSPEFWLNLENTYQIKTLNHDKLPHVVALVS